MDLQQKFGQRLLALLEEKNISQGEFAEKMDCSRQSVNFYVLGKRSPDICLAANMAKYFGVSCDYLVGFSDFRSDRDANFTASGVGMSERTMQFFAGLKLMASGDIDMDRESFEAFGFDYDKEVKAYHMHNANITLQILNDIISHDAFGVLLQYIKRYKDICQGKDELSVLQDFMVEMQSPVTGKQYGSKQENQKLMQEFCLHVISKYFDEIARDIAK